MSGSIPRKTNFWKLFRHARAEVGGVPEMCRGVLADSQRLWCVVIRDSEERCHFVLNCKHRGPIDVYGWLRTPRTKTEYASTAV